MNHLYYGDNLTIMQHMPKWCIDLIYLDPPFNSKTNYNLIYKNMTGKPVPDQAEAFCDTWDMDTQKEEIARSMPLLMREHGVEEYYVEFWRLWINALRQTQPHLLAYLIYMVQRLLYMKSILRPTGSIYLHCDPTASHYIKIMMDGIFGHKHFQNEIIWRRTGAHGRAKKWGPIHDVILFYTASDKYIWNRVFEKYDDSYVENFYKFNDEHGRYRLVTLDGPGTRGGGSGTPWRGVDPGTKGRHWEVPPDRALPNWFDHPNHYEKMTVQERLEIFSTLPGLYIGLSAGASHNISAISMLPRETRYRTLFRISDRLVHMRMSASATRHKSRLRCFEGSSRRQPIRAMLYSIRFADVERRFTPRKSLNGNGSAVISPFFQSS